MYTIRRSEDLWTVGIDTGDDQVDVWLPLYDCGTAVEAMELISFLNGGERPAWLGAD
jgi:hypothetical protein